MAPWDESGQVSLTRWSIRHTQAQEGGHHGPIAETGMPQCLKRGSVAHMGWDKEVTIDEQYRWGRRRVEEQPPSSTCT